METVAPVIEAAAIAWKWSIPKRALAIYGDPMRLTQALGNVLGNAAKYTDHGGRITLRARRRQRDVEITVSDTGIGIVPEVLPCIFDLFTQLDQTERPAPGRPGHRPGAGAPAGGNARRHGHGLQRRARQGQRIHHPPAPVHRTQRLRGARRTMAKRSPHQRRSAAVGAAAHPGRG